MPLIKDGGLVDDPWIEAGEADPLPDGPAIVPLVRWKAEREQLLGRNAGLGVRLRNTDDVLDLAADIGRLSVVVLEFPKFTDGRAYSQARLLRERLGYEGELRATGQVLPDQAIFLRRSGFDAFEAAETAGLEVWRRAFGAVTRFYQPASDGAQPLDGLRRAAPGRRP